MMSALAFATPAAIVATPTTPQFHVPYKRGLMLLEVIDQLRARSSVWNNIVVPAEEDQASTPFVKMAPDGQ